MVRVSVSVTERELFLGHFTSRIDAKGRVSVPAPFRGVLAKDGFEGRGPVVMAVEILPTEIPRESSGAFSEALYDLIPALAESDPSGRFEDWALPDALKKAVILHQGKLTERFSYMQKYVG